MKYIFLFPALFIVFLLNSCSSVNNLVTNGESNYKIFVSDSALQSEKHAAEELQQYLFSITGCRLPVTHEVSPGGKYIYVGFAGAPASLLNNLTAKKFGSEEYIIRSDGQDLLIAGGRPRGTLYGVVGYLSEHLGCRWYTKDIIKIPERKTVPLPNKDDRQQPAFEYREAWYQEAYNPVWAMHNRLNPSMVPVPDSLGGSYISYPFVHTFYNMVSPEKYFSRHPEYFSEINGKRVGKDAQLCLTNPDVVNIATETVLSWIKDHPEASIYALDQNDGLGYCECKDCKALDDAEGSHAGALLHFVNQVAGAVAKIYPNVKLQTLAYAYTEIPPKTLRPADNVTIRLCHYNYCSAHKIGGCKDHAPFIQRLEQWKAIAKRITVWDYFTDFNRYLMPFPNFEPVKHDLKFYADHGVKGLFAQGSNMPAQGGSEFSTLRAWVFAQLMWNPQQDAQLLIDEFVNEVYGKAAPFILEYIQLLHKQVQPDSVYFSIWSEPGEVNYLSPEIIKKADSLFGLAHKAAKEDGALFKRVELAYLPILYTKLYFHSTGEKAYIENAQVAETVDKFKRIIEENKITRIAEGEDYGNIAAFIKWADITPHFYTDWWIIGPFDNDKQKGMTTVFAAEKGFDTTAVLSGKNDMPVRWRKYDRPQSGYIDFAKQFDPSENVVAYARRTLMMDSAKNVTFGIGSNDGVRVWVNDRLVLDRQLGRRARINEDIITVALQKGNNAILVKVDQLKRGWGFYFTEIQ